MQSSPLVIEPLIDIKPDQVQFCIGERGTWKELGRGGRCTVYLAKYKDKLVAVKQLLDALVEFPPEQDSLEKYRKELFDEAEILQALAHPNIVRCFGGSKAFNFIVADFMIKGDLFSLIKTKDPGVAWAANGCKMAIQLAHAVAYMHGHNLLHNDLKTPNVLVDHNYDIKISDFGLARILTREYSTISSKGLDFSPLWASPEALKEDNGIIGLSSDVYSLGVMIWELWTQQGPWNLVPSHAVIDAVQRGETLALPADMPAPIAEILKACWSLDAARRWPARKVAPTLEDFIRKTSPQLASGVQPQAITADFNFDKITPESVGEYSKALRVLASHIQTNHRTMPPLLVWQIYEILMANISHASLYPADVVSEVIDTFVIVAKAFVDQGFEIKALEILRSVVTTAIKSGNLKQASSISLLIGKLFKLRIQEKTLPTTTISWEPLEFYNAAAGIRRLHSVLLLDQSPEDVTEAIGELTQTEALLLAQLSRSIVLWRLRNLAEPPKARLKALNDLTARLVSGGLVDHAWQLLMDGIACVEGFGQYNDEITLRLAELVPHVGRVASPYGPVELFPTLRSCRFFQNVPTTWRDYKNRLKAIRQDFLKSVEDKSITGEIFLQHQKNFTGEMKRLLAEIIRACEEVLGAAPCKFAFCCVGSMSAEDMNIYSDLEIVLLLETNDASAWEAVTYFPLSWKAPPSAGDYFKTLYNMVQVIIHCIGETATLGPIAEQSKYSGFHLDSTAHPGSELRLRGTAAQILGRIKPPHATLDDPLVYSLLTPAYIYGNDACVLLAKYECQITSELNSYFIPSPNRRFSILPTVSVSLKDPPPQQTWQQAIVQAQLKSHLKQAVTVGILPSNSEEMIKFGAKPEFTVLRLKSFATAVKFGVFDLARYHSIQARTVRECVEQLNRARIIPLTLANGIITFYAQLQKLRAKIHARMGYQAESFSLLRSTAEFAHTDALGDSTLLPPDTLNRNEIETVKLGVWGILQKLLFGNECVLNEFDQIPPLESAFPVEPPYGLIENATSLLMDGTLSLGDAEIAEIYNIIAFRQRSLNRICTVKRIARQLRPKQPATNALNSPNLNFFMQQLLFRKASVVIKVNRDRLVESMLSGFRSHVGSLIPFQIVFSRGSDAPGANRRKNSFEEFFQELPNSNLAEKRGMLDAWLPKRVPPGGSKISTTDFVTLGYILLRSILEDRPLTGAISLPVFKYILRGPEAALSAMELGLPDSSSHGLDEMKQALEAIRKGFLSVEVLRPQLSNLSPMDLLLICSQSNHTPSSTLVDKLVFEGFSPSSHTPQYLKNWILNADSNSLRRFLIFATENPGMSKISVRCKPRSVDSFPSSMPSHSLLVLPDYDDEMLLCVRLDKVICEISEGYY